MNDKLKQFYKNNQEQTSFSSEAKQRAKDKTFSRLTEPLPEKKISFWRVFVFKTYVIVPLILVIFITGTTVTSANAIPGDFLYPVKRKVESTRVLLAPTQDSKLNLQINFAEKRFQELDQVKDENLIGPQVASEQQTSDNERNERRSSRRIKARAEAEQALHVLEDNRGRLKERGDDKRIERVDKVIENLRFRLEDSSDDEGSDRDTDASEEVKVILLKL
jgi:hypothetical protein